MQHDGRMLTTSMVSMPACARRVATAPLPRAQDAALYAMLFRTRAALGCAHALLHALLSVHRIGSPHDGSNARKHGCTPPSKTRLCVPGSAHPWLLADPRVAAGLGTVRYRCKTGLRAVGIFRHGLFRSACPLVCTAPACMKCALASPPLTRMRGCARTSARTGERARCVRERTGFRAACRAHCTYSGRTLSPGLSRRLTFSAM